MVPLSSQLCYPGSWKSLLLIFCTNYSVTSRAIYHITLNIPEALIVSSCFCCWYCFSDFYLLLPVLLQQLYLSCLLCFIPSVQLWYELSNYLSKQASNYFTFLFEILQYLLLSKRKMSSHFVLSWKAFSALIHPELVSFLIANPYMWYTNRCAGSTVNKHKSIIQWGHIERSTQIISAF